MEFGTYNYNSIQLPFHIERCNSLFLGKSGDALQSLAIQDIYNNQSVVYLGDDSILDYIPLRREKHVLLFSPSEYPIPFNILAKVPEKRRPLFASTILEALKGIWGYENVPTPTLDQYLNAGILTLLSVPGATLLNLPYLLNNKSYRESLSIKDSVLKDFWETFDDMTPKEQRQDTASTRNKLNAILFEPYIRQCFDVQNNKLSFKNKIVLLSFKERDLGRANASIIGALALAQLYIEALDGLNTTLYVPDAHRFGNAILSSVMTVVPTLFAVPNLQKFKPNNREQIVADVDQIIAFRTSLKDSKELEPEFDIAEKPQGRFHLHELDYGVAYHTQSGLTTEVRTEPHTYPKTGARERILERCGR